MDGTCGHPAPDGVFLCNRCRKALIKDLRDIAGLDGMPSLVAELNLTITRGDHLTRNSLGIVVRSDEKPVPFNDAASEVFFELRRVVARWTRTVSHHHDHLQSLASTVEQAAEWLSLIPTLLAELPDAGLMREEIREVVHQVYRVIDRPFDRMYVGRCDVVVHPPLAPCGESLYAVEGRDTVECRACGTTWGVDEQRGWLTAQLVDQLAPASDLVGLVTSLGRYLTTPMIRSWKRRGMLKVVDVDDRGRDLFRVGTVLDLLEVA